MLTLVDSIMLKMIQDRPNLGGAMLIGACQAQGIKTTLVKGQTRYLQDIFINDVEELLGLIQDLTTEDLSKIGISNIINKIKKLGPLAFQQRLKELYEKLIIQKNPQYYLNGMLVEEINTYFNLTGAIYSHYLESKNFSGLKIVDRFLSEIINSQPRYIGFSLQMVREPISRIIRQRLKELGDIPIIVGGSATLPLIVEPDKIEKFFQNDFFDYLIIGAGEEALPALLHRLENEQEPEGIPNVLYMKNGQLKNAGYNVINDLNELPFPDFRQFDLEHYLTLEKILPIQDARGCPWKKCSFCESNRLYLGSYRIVSPERLVEIIKHLRETYNCRHFIFHGNGLPASRAEKISTVLIKSGLDDIHLASLARLTRNYNHNKLLSYMKKAGISTILWGLESGSQHTLTIMRKGTTVETIGQILKKSSKHGIANLCFVLFGFPGETREDADQTINFLKKHSSYIDQITHGLFIPCYGSPFVDNPAQWGAQILADGTVVSQTGMKDDELSMFYKKFMKQIYTNCEKFTSGRINNKPAGGELDSFYLQCTSHEMLFTTDAVDKITKGELSYIFPVITGEMIQKDGLAFLLPVNNAEPVFINSKFPEPAIELSEIEAKVFLASKGKSSIAEILLALTKDYEDISARQDFKQKIIAFYLKVFSKNWGLAFGKAWSNSYPSTDQYKSDSETLD